MLLSTGDRHETLVAVVLRFVDLNYATTHLTNLVDLLATFANDSTDHVVGNVDLLRCRTPGHALLNWLALRLAVHRRLGMTAHVWLRVGSGPVGRLLAAVLLGHGGVAMGSMLGILLRVGLGRHRLMALAAIMAAVVVIRAAKLSTSGLRAVGDDLHAAWNRSSWLTTPGSIGRGSGTTKAVVELLEESASNIVRGDVNGIGDTHDD